MLGPSSPIDTIGPIAPIAPIAPIGPIGPVGSARPVDPVTPHRPAARLAGPLQALPALLALLMSTASVTPLAAPAPGPGAAPGAADPASRPRLQREPTRGALLYETHCIACHDSQRHWRDQRLASDWPGLLAQVRAWQARASLHWSDADIVEVARHLNDTIYRFERPLAERERSR